MGDGKSQREGVDCDETFSLVVKPAYIQLILSIDLLNSWSIHQLDVKNYFLHGYLNEIVYIHQPLGVRERLSRLCLFSPEISSWPQTSLSCLESTVCQFCHYYWFL